MRVLRILATMVNRESRRIDLALARLIYLICATGVFVLVSALRGVPLGAWWEIPFFLLSAILAGFLGLRLAGDSVGERSSGFVELMCLTGARPGQWLSLRIMQSLVGFASVWLVRLPLLLLTWMLGPAPALRLMLNELWLCIFAGVLFAIGLGLTPMARSRPQLFGWSFLIVVAWECLLTLPYELTSRIALAFSLTPAAGVDSALTLLSSLSFVQQGREILMRLQAWESMARMSLAAAAFGLCWIVLYWRWVFAQPGMRLVEAAGTSAGGSKLARPSRRCWDDALAWQGYTIYAGGKRGLTFKCIAYLSVGIVLWATALYGSSQIATILFVAGTFVVLVRAVNVPGEYLQREVREQTLPVLLLAPLDVLDLYRGWRRGTWRSGWPEMILFLGVAGYGLSFGIEFGIGMIAVFLGMLTCGPFLMLSPLIPYTPRGMLTGGGAVFVLTVIIAVSIVLGVVWNPLLMLFVGVPSLWFFNAIVRHWLLQYWLRQKVESIL